jgi:hypothetical protein
MGEISTKQICGLALDISSNVVELQASIDELLVELRIHNRDMSGKQRLSEVSQTFSKALPK